MTRMPWRWPVLLLGMAAMAAAEVDPLPEWGEQGRAESEASGWVAGAALLTQDPLPDGTVASPVLPLAVEPSPEDAPGPEDAATVELPGEWWDAYFAARPEEYLVDPQKLLSQAATDKHLSFLRYHASDSSLDLFVYVLAGEQEIPGEVRQEEMMERLFSEGRPAAVVFYYLGQPERAELWLSPALTDVVSAAEQRRALQSAVMQASGRASASDPLEGFLVQMAMRVYWMERIVHGDASPHGETREAAAAPDKAKEPSTSAKLWMWVEPWMVPAGGALAAVAAVAALWVWMRLRARYRFPEVPVEPRLGGEHAAGVGAVIGFADAFKSPAEQRHELPPQERRF